MRRFVALVAAGQLGAVLADRVPNSPYVVPSRGLNATLYEDRTLFVVREAAMSADNVVTVQALQGIASQTAPAVFRVHSGGVEANERWAEALANSHGLRLDQTFASDAAGLLKELAPRLGIKGYVLMDLANPAPAYTALAGSPAPLALVTKDNEEAATAIGLSLAYDVRSWTVDQAVDTFNTTADAFARRLAVLQDPKKPNFLGDFAIASRAVTWWDTSMTSSLSKRVLGSLQEAPVVLGWGTSEDGVVGAVSDRGGYVVATDWAQNLDVLSSFDIPTLVQKPAPKQDVDASADDVHTVTFLMTDGDNICWLLDDFTMSSSWFGSQDRGSVPLGWTISPSLSELAPSAMQWMYSQASDKAEARDVFVAGPSGAGYFYPDMLGPDALNKVTSLTDAYMAKAGLRLVNVIAQRYSEAAASAYTALPNVDGVFWYDYYSYAALQGNLTFLNGKPVIGGRWQLWTGTFEDVDTIIANLQKAPRTTQSADGYSLIPVHVWSNSVSDVRKIVEAVQASGGVRVVPPDEFVKLVTANLGPKDKPAKAMVV